MNTLLLKLDLKMSLKSKLAEKIKEARVRVTILQV